MKEIYFRYTFKRKRDGIIWRLVMSMARLEGGAPELRDMMKNDQWELLARDQYIGKDKNGADLYEEDIVSAPFSNGENRKDKKTKKFNVDVSINHEAGAELSFPKAAWKGDYRWVPALSEVEKIGDIHQNPELLEEQNNA